MLLNFFSILFLIITTVLSYGVDVQAEKIVKIVTLSGQIEADRKNAVMEFLDSTQSQAVNDFKLNNANQNSQGVFSPSVDRGAPFLPVPARCDYNTFENSLWAATPKDFGQIVNKYMKSCGSKIASHGDIGITGQLAFLLSKYNLLSLPNSRRVEFQFSDGTRLEAYISVKGFDKKRPWVIAKCGVLCSLTEDAGVANAYMSLFDQSPFNLIFLENRTGNNFIEKNNSLTFGGYLESADLFHVSEWLQYESEYKDTVDSVHAFGESLGANAALLVSQLGDRYQAKNPKPLFNSVIAVCPVVNLGPSIDDIYGSSFKGNIFSSLSWYRFQKLKSHLPEASDYLNSSKPKGDDFQRMVKEIGFRYTSKYFSEHPEVPIDLINSVDDLMNKGQFVNYKKMTQIPILILASNDDFVVDPALNTKTIGKSIFANDPNVGVAIVKEGTHCALSQAYSTHLISRILRNFIMKQSPSFSKGPEVSRIEYAFNIPKIDPKHIHIGQYWKVSKDSDSADLVFVMHDPTTWICPWQDPLDANDACKYDVTAKIPFTDLAKLGISTPQTKAEVEKTNRQLNAMVKAKIGSSDAYDISGQPNGLEWMAF
jgi:hypothetical protein